MSIPTLIYFLAVIAVLPAAIRVSGRPFVRNATAFALVAMWLFSRLVWALTGEYLPLEAMFIQDMVVIGAMFVKTEWVACPYRSRWHQFACIWIERSPWDKAILAIFPVAWLLYASAPVAFIAPSVRLLFPAATDGQIQFWILWSLSLGQLILAGLEGFHLAGNGQTLRAADERPPGLGFTAWRRLYG